MTQSEKPVLFGLNLTKLSLNLVLNHDESRKFPKNSEKSPKFSQKLPENSLKNPKNLPPIFARRMGGSSFAGQGVYSQKILRGYFGYTQGSPMDRPSGGVNLGGLAGQRITLHRKKFHFCIIQTTLNTISQKNFWKKPWFNQFCKYFGPFPGGVGGTPTYPPMAIPGYTPLHTSDYKYRFKISLSSSNNFNQLWLIITDYIRQSRRRVNQKPPVEKIGNPPPVRLSRGGN